MRRAEKSSIETGLHNIVNQLTTVQINNTHRHTHTLKKIIPLGPSVYACNLCLTNCAFHVFCGLPLLHINVMNIFIYY